MSTTTLRTLLRPSPVAARWELRDGRLQLRWERRDAWPRILRAPAGSEADSTTLPAAA